jgi:hypothetical protein
MLRRAKGAQRGDHADVAIQVEGEEKRFFFEKKKQKIFITLGRAGFNATVQEEAEVFCAAFF